MRQLISVIIPIYNEETNLRRCVDSVIKQTYTNLEIILVDDGSNDKSGSICDEYVKVDARVKVIHKVNGGLSSARNAGIDVAQGDYIGFVDSDDWISPIMYEYLLKLLNEKKADVAQIDYIHVSSANQALNEGKGTIECIQDKNEILKRYLIDGMKVVKSYAVWTKLYKRECFSNIRFPLGQLYEDIVTNFDILQNVSCYVISDRVCYYYYKKPESITRSTFVKKDLDYILVGEQLVERTLDSPDLNKYACMTLGRFHFMCICKMIKYGCSTAIDSAKIVDNFIPIIKANATMLLISKMQFGRKILLLLICINKTVTYYLIKFRTCKGANR